MEKAMTITSLDLGAWISLYFGVRLIRASFPPASFRGERPAPMWKSAVVGILLLVVGLGIVARLFSAITGDRR